MLGKISSLEALVRLTHDAQHNVQLPTNEYEEAHPTHRARWARA